MISILESTACELGEGLYYDTMTSTTYWFDINKSLLFSKSKSGSNCYILENNPSCVLNISLDKLLYIDSCGIKTLNLTDSTIESVCTVEHDPEKFRCNDGVLCSDGSILFGTMCRNPGKGTGVIYRYFNNELEVLGSIGIPNTFVELQDSILISDSLLKKTYSYSKETYKSSIWKDFSENNFTPDGGTLSDGGYVYISFWDGACIKKFDVQGKLVDTLPLPVLRPTNCKFTTDNKLIVTSAYEGLSEKQLELYPHSGKTFELDLSGDI